MGSVMTFYSCEEHILVIFNPLLLYPISPKPLFPFLHPRVLLFSCVIAIVCLFLLKYYCNMNTCI